MDTQLQLECQQSIPDFLKRLEMLVNIETPTGYQEGSLEFATLLKQWFEELGCEIELLKTEVGCFNIKASLRGKGRGRILLSAHSDTVFPIGTLSKVPFKVMGNKVYGPGCIDCKGGILLGLYAMQLLQKQYSDRFECITFIINADEETGSQNSKKLIMETAKQHDVAVVLEAAKLNYGICIGRKGLGKVDLVVKGKRAHAARWNEGINAVTELARLIVAIDGLKVSVNNTAVNVTVMNGGDVENSIPDYATAHVDIRGDDMQEMEAVIEHIQNLSRKPYYPESIISTSVVSQPAFSLNERTNFLADKVHEIYQEIGIMMHTVTSPGVSDANYIAQTGIPVIDGMSFIGMKAHTSEEYGEVDSISNALYTLVRFIYQGEFCA